GGHAYLYGAATGVWNVDWITIWGMVLFNTLGVSGVFENFRRWLIALGGMDVRVQTMLFAWAFGALLEGLVGFGYPWAVVAPILISLGISDLNAIRIAAIANNAPVSYGALGAPIIALAAVTGYPLLAPSGSVGPVFAVLALAPRWLPFGVLLIVVAAWTGPWSPLPKVSWFKATAVACSSLATSCPTKGNVTAVFNFAPYIGGSAILASWIIVAVLLLAMGRLKGAQLGEVFRRTFHQMWGACL